MELTRRRVLTSLAASVGLAGVAGCGGETDPNKITVLMEDISYTDNIRSMLPAFAEATGISVTIETVPYSDQVARILQGFSQESSYYDAVFTDNTYGRGFFDAGFVRGLSSLATAHDEFTGLNEYFSPYIDALRDADGNVYGIPVYGESTFLMYRADLFEQYGITAPPVTIEDLRDAAATIQEGSRGEIAGISLRGAAGIQAVYPWAGILRSFGGRFVHEDGSLAISEPSAVEAATYWAELLQEFGAPGIANFDWEQNRIAFTQGRSAMTIDATANGPFNEDKTSSTVAGMVGYAPVPYASGIEPDGDNTTASLNVHAFYINTVSNKSVAAYRFISWATSEAVQAHAVDTVESVGATLTSVLDSEAYVQRYGTFRESMMTQLENGNPDYLPGGVTANVVITEVGQALSNILSGQAEAQSALDLAASNIEAQTA